MLAWRVADNMTTIFPYIARKRRLAAFTSDGHRLSISKLCFDRGCTAPLCAAAVHLNRFYLKDYRSTRWTSRLTALPRATAAIIDLRRFPTFDDYAALVARHSNGNDVRMMKKARRLGFETRNIAPRSHARSHMAIIQSKLVRSHGVVKRAAGAPIVVDSDLRHAYEAPACPHHWVIEKGVFQKDDPLAPMVAHAQLVRSGNLVNLIHFMGHGAYLKQGVAKLLIFDIIASLLDAADSNTRGVDYLLYGAMEHGNEGAFNWRRYMEFKPFLLDMPRDRRPFVPEDFDPEAYLRFNPEAADAASPASHYIYHGAFEGKRYRD